MEIQFIEMQSQTGLQIKSTANNSNGIHIAFNKNGKASGEAYLQFQTVEDMNQALKRNMEKLGHRLVIAKQLNLHQSKQIEFKQIEFV